MRRALSDCCGDRADFLSYNRELKPEAPPDHHVCVNCGKKCGLVDENGQALMEEMLWVEYEEVVTE